MRTLILHIGTHKTGTTSIQAALAESREWLAGHGLIYPDGGPIYGKSRVPHHKWSHGLTGADADLAEKSRAYVNHIASLGRHDDTLIISAEPLYRHIDGYLVHDLPPSPDYWKRRERYVRNVSAALHRFDVRVVVWLREKQSFAQSLFGELQKKGRWKGSLDQFMIQYEAFFDYERQLQLFQEAFTSVDIFSYETASQAGLVPYFFEKIGFPTPPGVEDLWLRRLEDPLPLPGATAAVPKQPSTGQAKTESWTAGFFNRFHFR